MSLRGAAAAERGFFMNYRIDPAGAVWRDGMFFVPAALAEKYIRLASEYQIKALLIILGRNGAASAAELAKKLGITEADAENIMEFWAAEGVVLELDDDEKPQQRAARFAPEKPAQPAADKADTKEPSGQPAESRGVKPARLSVKAPSLSPREIVEISAQKPHIEQLLNEAQRVYGRTISHSEQEMIVNLSEFYGMPSEVLLLLLAYCDRLRKQGKSVSAGYFYKTAQSWAEEGIDTYSLADRRIFELEQADIFWKELKQAGGFTRVSPTEKQTAMICAWRREHSDEMILRAAEIMSENIEKPDFRYMDKILSNWKNAGVTTPQEAKRESESFEKKKNQKKAPAGSISRKPTYDLEKIKDRAKNNTDIKY